MKAKIVMTICVGLFGAALSGCGGSKYSSHNGGSAPTPAASVMTVTEVLATAKSDPDETIDPVVIDATATKAATMLVPAPDETSDPISVNGQ